jgi:hypothetical protein
MGCNSTQSQLGSVRFDDMPDRLLGDVFAPGFSRATHAPKYLPCRAASQLAPLVNLLLHPVRHRNGADVPSLADQVYDSPMVFAALYVDQIQIFELARRNPQPNRTANIARSRASRKVLRSGSSQRACASSSVSQLPRRTPSFLASFTRRMPAANSGLSRARI